MNFLQKMQTARPVRIIRTLLGGQPRSLKLARQLVSNKSGLEIGGPSAVFRRWFNLPIYGSVGSLDNCDFSQNTEWARHTPSYCFAKGKPCGKAYFCEGSNLAEIPNATYDFLLSSHNLEHFANPVKALREWQRVVKPNGHMIIVLPHYARTFDRHRTPTPVSHMLEDFNRGTDEDDLTHVEETVRAHMLNDPSQSEDELRTLLLNNYQHRMLHHHVFDEDNSRLLMEAVSFEVLAVETQLPFHIYLIVRTPSAPNGVVDSL